VRKLLKMRAGIAGEKRNGNRERADRRVQEGLGVEQWRLWRIGRRAIVNGSADSDNCQGIILNLYHSNEAAEVLRMEGVGAW
jgi:hypothetical protein